MKREHLEHILRAASQIAGDTDVLILGSQSILGTFTEDELPEKAHASVEVSITWERPARPLGTSERALPQSRAGAQGH